MPDLPSLPAAPGGSESGAQPSQPERECQEDTESEVNPSDVSISPLTDDLNLSVDTDSGDAASDPDSDSDQGAAAASSAAVPLVSNRGIFGRHGEKHRQAIQKVLPFLKEQLRLPGALGLPERSNVREALKKASEQGQRCWGPGEAYKHQQGVESAILNMYYQAVVASLHQPD